MSFKVLFFHEENMIALFCVGVAAIFGCSCKLGQIPETARNSPVAVVIKTIYNATGESYFQELHGHGGSITGCKVRPAL